MSDTITREEILAALEPAEVTALRMELDRLRAWEAEARAALELALFNGDDACPVEMIRAVLERKP